MTKIALLSAALAAIALLLPAAPAQAQLARTFVSAAGGNDANDCNRATPCRTFQGAHDKTLANGEITVLDPGGYGAVTIAKTISIINDGVGEAGVLVSGGANGITISAGASDAVSLRGLTVKGIGFGGGNGIRFNSGKSLTIENCVVRNLTGGPTAGFGIRFQPNASSSLSISNTLVADNDNTGISVSPAGSGSTTKVVLNRVEAYNNTTTGINLNGNGASGDMKATITDSVVQNSGTGILAISDAGGQLTDLMVIRSTVANNGTGLSADGANMIVRLGGSTVTGNTTGWQAQNIAQLLSFGDNNIEGNTFGQTAPPVVARK
jgi:hypothetical protein